MTEPTVKNDLKAALRLIDKLTDIEAVKNNQNWFGRLNHLANDMKLTLGAILVKEEMGNGRR